MSTDPLDQKPEFWLQLFLSLLNPTCKRNRLSNLRTIISLGLMQLYDEEHGRETFPGRKTICKWASFKSKWALSRFTSSIEFALFGDKFPQRKGRKSCTYKLERPVLAFVRLFKQKGLLTGIDRDPKKWAESFENKIRKWLLPIATDSAGIDDFMNKLSTKKRAKMHPSDPLKCTLSLPKGIDISLTDIKTIPAYDAPSFSYDFFKKAEEIWSLGKSVGLSEGDMRHFSFKESLSVVENGLRTLSLRLNNGWQARSPVRALQSLVNAQKIQRKKWTCF